MRRLYMLLQAMNKHTLLLQLRWALVASGAATMVQAQAAVRQIDNGIIVALFANGYIVYRENFLAVYGDVPAVHFDGYYIVIEMGHRKVSIPAIMPDDQS